MAFCTRVIAVVFRKPYFNETIYFNFRSLWWFISFRWLYNIVRILWVIVNNFYVIPAYFAWLIILFPVYFVSPITFWHIEDVLFGWLLNMVACWNYTGTEIIFPTSNSSKVSFKFFFKGIIFATTLLNVHNHCTRPISNSYHRTSRHIWYINH